MNKTKSTFSICDMENISGIKAHTIRIWEKRYNVLTPKRASRDIRSYDLQSLQKLLNITYLLERKFKISHIASLNNVEIEKLVKNLDDESTENNVQQQLKLAMFSFDADLFEEVCKKEALNKDFSEVYKNVFIPFLQFLGMQWQTNTISIAHEHFITNLIFQKIQGRIDNLNKTATINSSSETTYVLYLPQEEMHEMSLLFLNYELKLRGLKTIYLGRTIPVSDMEILKKTQKNLCLISVLTIYPSEASLQIYFNELGGFLAKSNHKHLVVGHKLQIVDFKNTHPSIKIFENTEALLTHI